MFEEGIYFYSERINQTYYDNGGSVNYSPSPVFWGQNKVEPVPADKIFLDQGSFDLSACGQRTYIELQNLQFPFPEMLVSAVDGECKENMETEEPDFTSDFYHNEEVMGESHLYRKESQAGLSLREMVFVHCDIAVDGCKADSPDFSGDAGEVEDVFSRQDSSISSEGLPSSVPGTPDISGVANPRLCSSSEDTDSTDLLSMVSPAPCSNEYSCSMESSGVLEKPSLSYAAIITRALEKADGNRATVPELYQLIVEEFPYFATVDKKSWQSSMRSTLCMNDAFAKCSETAGQKQGGHWVMSPNKVHAL
ncbi:forkhead box transcription factor [Endozoicomonas atrinae]|uniref:forkhead box transcription factor n=1 Tax=Endozoicomonas atrinae TaxID=1333660 RepID=UPI0008257E9B|nr:forkhead box transcription factor [Endozoicomonas atrinae]